MPGQNTPQWPHLELVETAAGQIAVFKNDTGVSRNLKKYGEFGAGELGFYDKILGKGDVFVDVGANIGAISWQLAKRRPDTIIWAFEPQIASYYLAALNTITLPLCKVFPIALGADDRIIFAPELNPFGTGNFGSLPLINKPHDVDLPMAQTRLDRFLEKRGQKPRLIKIDVEGMEDQVIEGAKGLFHRDLVLSIEADRAATVEKYLPDLLAAGANCQIMFLPIISKKNPLLIAENPAQKTATAHIFAFFGEISAELKNIIPPNSELTSIESYRQKIGPIVSRTEAALSHAKT